MLSTTMGRVQSARNCSLSRDEVSEKLFTQAIGTQSVWYGKVFYEARYGSELGRGLSVFVCTICDTPLESDCGPQALLWTP